MNPNLSEVIAPNDDCRRLRHPTQWFQASPAGDRIEGCNVCTLAYREALRAGKSEAFADALVQRLRRESHPYDEVIPDDPGEHGE